MGAQLPGTVYTVSLHKKGTDSWQTQNYAVLARSVVEAATIAMRTLPDMDEVKAVNSVGVIGLLAEVDFEGVEKGGT